MKYYFGLICVLCSTAVYAETISNTNIVLSNQLSNYYSLLVYQNEDKTDYTEIFVELNGNMLSAISSCMDEGSDWYLVDYATSLDYSNPLIQTTETSIETYTLDVGYGNFYLAVNTGNAYGYGWPPRNIYGWAELNNTNGQLSMINNSITYDSGMVMSTAFIGVPEPSSIILLFLGLCFLCCKVLCGKDLG
jgi:hypothetical protein